MRANHVVGASQLGSKATLPGGTFITNVFDQVAQLTNTALLNSSLALLNFHA